jgi:hypothetical protein
LAQSEYKKRHDIFAKIIHMNSAVKFNLLKNTQPHYSYTPESCLENDSYKLSYLIFAVSRMQISQKKDQQFTRENVNKSRISTPRHGTIERERK